MNTTLAGVSVNVCSSPAFMGHEEIILPIAVLYSSENQENNAIGSFWTCMGREFHPNDLSNTAVVGLHAGTQNAKIDVTEIFVGGIHDKWTEVPEVLAALDSFDQRYAFFLEESSAPLQDAFIWRCRLVAQSRLHDFHPNADIEAETTQTCSAYNLLTAFLSHCAREPHYQSIYGDYFTSNVFRRLYGDDEQYRPGYAIWLEQQGVIRAWTRVAYIPK